MTPDTKAAEQFLRERRFFSDPYTSKRVERLMTEFAAKEAQLFAEWTAGAGWVFNFRTCKWLDTTTPCGKQLDFTELYNSKEYQLYKEGNK